MIKVLIVDDHPVVRHGLQQILAQEPDVAEAAEAKSAAELMQRLGEADWDVVVLDISLPDRSGLEVLKDVKAAHPKLPVLILSMHPEEQYAIRVLKAGASGYVSKDSAAEELVKAIRKVLGGGRYVSLATAEQLAASLTSDRERPRHELLSDREFEVMRLLAAGKRASEIAAELSLSVKTVSTYRSRLLEKMGMKSNAELTSYAIRNGLIE